jgi:HEAT repeat protein
MSVVPESRLSLFAEMEDRYEKKDVNYFVGLLDHDDYVVRTRATCILVDFGGEDKIPYIAKAAFSLGQMGYRSAIPHLEDATKNDPSMFVRHEAAIALGVVGAKEAKHTLEEALKDPSVPVQESAVVALSNLIFMEKLSKNEKFAKLTGG